MESEKDNVDQVSPGEKRLCIWCHKLGSSLRKISASEGLIEIVREKIFDGYSCDNDSLPSVICDGCRKAARGDRGQVFTKKFDYDKLTRSMPRGMNSDQCQCYICQKVKEKQNQTKHLKNNKRKPGPKSHKLRQIQCQPKHLKFVLNVVRKLAVALSIPAPLANKLRI